MENKHVANKNEDELSIKELISKINDWVTFFKNKWLVLLAFGITGAFIGLGFSFFKKTSYIATSTFVLEEGEKSAGLGQYAGLASMAGIDLGGGGGLFQGDNIIELYRSRTMIQKALLSLVSVNGKKELLIDRYIAFNELRNKWKDEGRLRNLSFEPIGVGRYSRLQDSVIGVAVADIKKNYLSVTKPDKKLSIIKVEVNSPDEYFSKLFNDQIVENVNDFYIQTKTKKSIQNIDILQQKTDSVRAVMNGQIFHAAEVLDATPNLNSSRQAQRTGPVQRSQFGAETNKMILSELVKNLELSKITLRKETPLIQIVDQPIFPLEISRIGKIKGGVIGAVLFLFFGTVFLTVKFLIRRL